MIQAVKIEPGRALTNAVDNETLARHRWYPIKEGFSANFVRESLDELDAGQRKKALAIEPFSGSGTSPVECARLNVDCLAFEVNPFLAFVGKTKLRQVDPKKLKIDREQVTAGLRKSKVSPLEKISTFCESEDKEKWLFNKSVLRSFESGWNAIKDTPTYNRAFYRLALIRAMMDNCNAYPDGKCLRYKRLDSYECFDRNSLIEKFEHYSGMIEEDLESTPFNQKISSIENMDSRNIKDLDPRRKFDLCVTSPPYLNSFDYSDVYRPELFLAGYVENNSQLMQIRMKTLRSHVQAKWATPVKESFGVLYTEVIKEILEKQKSLWSPRIPEMIQAYFEDMEGLLVSLFKRANPRALLKIAVSTSAYGGVVVPVDLILAEIAESSGWQLQEVQVIRRLRSSAQNWKHGNNENGVPALRESVVVVRAP